MPPGSRSGPMPRADMLDAIRNRFGYAFKGRRGYPAILAGEVLPDRLAIGGIVIDVVDQPHGAIHSAGLRFTTIRGSIGYATDFHELTPAMADLYRGLDWWVVDALRHAPHPTHPTVAQALGWIEQLRPGRSALVQHGSFHGLPDVVCVAAAWGRAGL